MKTEKAVINECVGKSRNGPEFCENFCEFRNTIDCTDKVPSLDHLSTKGELLNTIEILLRLNIPILWIAPHGIGKTQIFRQVTQAMGWRIQEVHLPYKERVDLTGRMEPSEDKKHTVYLPPEWFPIKDDKNYNVRTVINFDELNRAPQDILRAVLPLIQEGVVNELKLPSHYRRVAAINPWDEEYNVFDLEPALLDRVCLISDLPSQMDWLTWAKKSENSGRMSKALVTAIKKGWTIFDWMKIQMPEKKPTPRGVAVFDKFVSFAPIQVYEKFGLKIASGLLGGGAQLIWESVKKELKHEHLDYPLSGKDILKNIDQYADRLLGWKKGTIRADLINASMLSLAQEMQHINVKSQNQSVTDEMAKNIKKFIELLPQDFVMAFLKHIREQEDWMVVLGEQENTPIDRVLLGGIDGTIGTTNDKATKDN